MKRSFFIPPIIVKVGLISLLLGTIAPTAIAQISRPQVQAVTVRIDRPREPGKAAAGGSGVLVKQEGDRYSVLTNCHVIKGIPGTYTLWINGNDRYAVSVPDPGRLCQGRVDLAVLTFTSTQDYSIASLRSEPNIDVLVNEGTPITAAGFPNSYDGIRTRPDLIFDPRGGSILQPNKTDPEGYELVHSITTLDGMSGGPVFDVAGKLIAINGRTLRSNTGRAESYYYAAIPIHYYTNWSPPPVATDNAEIFCDMSGAEPMTVRELGRDKFAIIIWRSEFWSRIGFTPEIRCHMVSNVLNNLREERGKFKVVIGTTTNGENAICAIDATRQVALRGVCETLIFTVEPTENIVRVYQEFIEILTTTTTIRLIL